MRKVTALILLIMLIILLNCSKQEMGGKGNDTPEEILQPIIAYNLNISEPSGIAYNSVSDLFMIVSDNRHEIFLVDSTGNIKSTILTSSSDMEGITLSPNCDTLFIVEETSKMVVAYNSSGIQLFSFLVDVATNSDHALEGIARNTLNQRLIILNEKLPCLLLEYENSKEIWRKEINYSSDISDISFDEENKCWWIVSDESQKIFKLNMDMDIISEWRIPVNQAEGIAIVRDKIYIISDAENKMYIFSKPA